MTKESEQRAAAAKLLTAAWSAAAQAEVPPSVMTATALSLAIGEMVANYGEEATSRTLARIGEQVTQGAFSHGRSGADSHAHGDHEHDKDD